MDPQYTNDGKPYAPIRYKEIVKECYILSKNINTSYLDLLMITPTERHFLISFLQEEAKANQEYIEKKRAEREANKNYR